MAVFGGDNKLGYIEFYSSNKRTNLKYSYKHIGLQEQGNQGNMAIYSHYPQLNKGIIKLNDRNKNNTCIYSDIIIKKDTIRVYNVHLASNWFNNSDYLFIKNPMNKKIKKGIIGIVNRMKDSTESS